MAASYLYIALQVLATAIAHRVVSRRFMHPLRNYPGPFLASVTNLWKLYFYLIGSQHVVDEDMHRLYGPVVRTGPDSLSFASPAAFEAIYGFNAGLEKGDFYSFARDPTTGAANLFSARTHAEHREHRRKVAAAALSPAHVRSYAPVVEKYARLLVAKLAAADTTDDALDVAEPVHALTFNTMAELIYGPSLSPDGQPWTDTAGGKGVLAGFRGVTKYGWAAAHVPFLAWLMHTGPVMRMMRKPTVDAAGNPTGLAALAARANVLLREDPGLVTQADQPSMAKNMLAAAEGDSRHMVPDEVYRECFNLLFAGPGSTAAAVTGALDRLGSPEGVAWQGLIRADLAQGRTPADSQVLDAVVRETMRHSAPFPTAFPREVRRGAEKAIAGLDEPLPLGTLVGANSWIVSHDKDAWGSDAGQWKPDRWLVADDGARKALDDKFIVFSKGPRGCLGRDLAMSIVKHAVAAVVAKWRIESVGDFEGGAWMEMQVERCGLKLTEI